jgi:type I restriction enzyme S subunit
LISCRIKDIARINRRTLPESTDRNTAFRYIDISSVNDLGQIEIPDEEVTFATAPSRARRIAPAGSVVISTVRTYLRAIAWVPITKEPLVFSTGFAVLEAGPEVDSRYLFYYCRSQPFIDEVVARSVGVSYPAINASEIGTLQVQLQDLREQRRIADFLDAETAHMDRVHQLRKRQLALLAERRAAALSRCVNADQPDANRHPIVGSIPYDWPVLPIRRIVPRVDIGVVINPSTHFTNDGVPFIHGFNVQSGRIDPRGMKYMSPESNASLRRSRLRAGDVLVVRAGAPGRAAVVPDEYDGANCASVLILRRGKRLLPEFLAAFINSPAGQGQVRVAQYGAAQDVISAGQATSFVAPMPDLVEQRRRVEQLASDMRFIDQLATSVEKQLQLLVERRQALITAAVTGQFDVSSASGRGVIE